MKVVSFETLFIFYICVSINNIMTFSQELRQSIIQQVLSGKQYRDISKEMGISIGSIANIAKKHRAENERACSKQGQGQPKSNDVNISEAIKSIDSSTFLA